MLIQQLLAWKAVSSNLDALICMGALRLLVRHISNEVSKTFFFKKNIFQRLFIQTFFKNIFIILKYFVRLTTPPVHQRAPAYNRTTWLVLMCLPHLPHPSLFWTFFSLTFNIYLSVLPFFPKKKNMHSRQSTMVLWPVSGCGGKTACVWSPKRRCRTSW